jgi:hypothetical protein
MVQTRKKQTIDLPPPMDLSTFDLEDLNILWKEEVKSVAKRRQKLEAFLKKGYATVYDQHSQEVCDELKAMVDWERIQKEQSLHELIQKTKRICVCHRPFHSGGKHSLLNVVIF